MVHLNGQGFDAPGFGAAEENDFDSGDAISLLDAVGLDGDFDSGQIVFSRPNGVHVTVDWGALENMNGAPADYRCTFVGSAQIASPGRDPKARKRIDFRADVGRGRGILRAGGLRLRARCYPGGELDVVAKIHANGQGTSAPYAWDNNLRVGQRFAFLAALGTDSAQTGQLIYANPKGTVVTADWLVEDLDPYEGRRDCAFVGTARVVRKGDTDRAWFAPMRTKPIIVPRAAPRGVPAPDFRTFHKRGPFSLIGGCSTVTELYDHSLDVYAAYGRAGGFTGNEQSRTGINQTGSTAVFQSSGPLLETPSDNSGHAAMFTTDGAIMTVDWLAQERTAFGTKKLRRKCLFAGTTEFFRAPK
jgi:hypothetical protein